MSDFIDDLKSEMARILYDELRSAQSLKFQAPFFGMFYIHTFQILDLDTRVE